LFQKLDDNIPMECRLARSACNGVQFLENLQVTAETVFRQGEFARLSLYLQNMPHATTNLAAS